MSSPPRTAVEEPSKDTACSRSSNDRWLTTLRDPDRRDEAIGRLTDLLVAGLSRSFSAHHGRSVAVEDIAQEAILKVLRSLDDFRGDSRFTTWAMAIAVRTGLSELRRREYQCVSLESISDEGWQPMSAASRDFVEQRHDRELIVRQLGQLIESELTPRQRTCILAQLDGMPVEVIATKLNSNRNAIYKLTHDARVRLRDGFQALGIEAEDIKAVLPETANPRGHRSL